VLPLSSQYIATFNFFSKSIFFNFNRNSEIIMETNNIKNDVDGFIMKSIIIIYIFLFKINYF
jgi:hypothetical protein